MLRRRLLVVCLALVGVLLPSVPFVRELEERSVDARFQLRGPRETAGKVVVIAIDDATEQAWAEKPAIVWPSEFARLIKIASESGARSIGVDFVISIDAGQFFTSKGLEDDPIGDLLLALGDHPGAVLATAQAGDVVRTLELATRLGSVNTNRSATSVVRQAPRRDGSFRPPMPGFAAALTEPTHARLDPIDINYSGKPIHVVSAAEVLKGAVDPEVFRDAVVIVGETYSGTADIHDTPYGPSVPGVLIHAEAVQTLLDDAELEVVPPWLGALLCGLVSVGLALLAQRHWLWGYAIVCVPALAAYAGLCFALFKYQDIISPVVPIAFTALIVVPGVVYSARALEERTERQRLRAQWGQMISEPFARKLEAAVENKLGGMGQFRGCFLFLDVTGFSEFTEKHRDNQSVIIENLNRLFDPAIGCCREAGGEVLSFTGDGLSAMWEQDADEPDGEIRFRVLSTALAILRAIDALNRDNQFGSESWDVRIGLSYGQVTLALVGDAKRKQMTLYGSAVNLAARCEQAGKNLTPNAERPLRSRLVAPADFVGAAERTGKRFREVVYHPKGWDHPMPLVYLDEQTPVEDGVHL